MSCHGLKPKEMQCHVMCCRVLPCNLCSDKLWHLVGWRGGGPRGAKQKTKFIAEGLRHAFYRIATLFVLRAKQFKDWGMKINHKVNDIYKACSSSEDEVGYVGATKPVQVVNPETREEQLSASSGMAPSIT